MTLLMRLLTSILPRLFQDLLKNPRSLLSIFLRRDNPQSIKQSYYRDAIARIDKRYQIGNEDEAATNYANATPFERSYVKASLAKEAERFEQRADRHWGRASPRHRFRSAWLYALAGYCYQQSEDPRAASAYHYAANSFRNVESFEQAIEHYKKAADLLGASNDNPDLRVRSLMRALGVSRVAGDLNREESLLGELTPLLAHLVTERSLTDKTRQRHGSVRRTA